MLRATDGTPLDLTNATVVVATRAEADGDSASRAFQASVEPNGVVKWTWPSLPATGWHRCEFRVARDGKQQTVPTRGFVSILFEEAVPAPEPPGLYAELSAPAVEAGGAWSLTMKRGDTLPPLYGILREPPTEAQRRAGVPGTPLDLAGRRITLLLTPVNGTPIRLLCVQETAAPGAVRVDWTCESTATAASYRCDIEEGPQGEERPRAKNAFTLLVAEPLSG
jgi:hypothetical protein